MTITSAPFASTYATRLRGMFAPVGIAIVGASDNSPFSGYTVENLRQGGYPHPIHMVNRSGGTVHGQPSYRSLAELPGPVDLACVLIGRTYVLDILRDVAAAGIRNVVVVAAGFAETGADGRTRQAEMVELAAELGLNLLGPNNQGFVNTWSDTYAFSGRVERPVGKGGVSFLSHSGALATLVVDQCVSRDVGISHFVSLGNEAQIGIAEGIDYLVADETTRVIALYIESVRHPEAFLAACDRAMAAGKPVVVYKAGRGRLSARVAEAHTGSLVGDDDVVSAVFEQHGVIRADSIEEWVATAAILDNYEPFAGNRVGFVTPSGAMCGVITDTIEGIDLDVPDLMPATVERLREVLPEFATPQNPLDTTAQVSMGDTSNYARALQIMAEDPQLDLLVVGAWYSSDHLKSLALESIVDSLPEVCRTSPIPIMPMALLPVEQTPFAKHLRRDRNLPYAVESYSVGLPALAKAMWWARRQRDFVTPVPAPAIPTLAPTVDTTGAWNEHRTLELLCAAGVPAIPSSLCTDPASAAQAADEIGYPVALKISSPDIAHKSDVGGVVLGLRSAGDVERAAARMLDVVAQSNPDASIDGLLVSPMRSEGTELLLGVVRDSIWGLMMAVGLGGVWVEVLDDVALARLPVSRERGLEMLGSLKGGALLRGARNRAPVDLDAVADVIEQVSDLAMSLGQRLMALEINPLRVDGSAVEALDALVQWAEDVQ